MDEDRGGILAMVTVALAVGQLANGRQVRADEVCDEAELLVTEFEKRGWVKAKR